MSRESWVVTGPQIIEVDDVTSVRAQIVGGRLDIVADDRDDVRVEVHSVDGRPLEVALDGGELRVGYAFTLGGWEGFLEKFRNFRDKDHVDVHIAVPRFVPVKLGTVSADGLLAGVQQDASVSTVSGSLVTDGTRGRLSTNTVSGEIAVRDHDGDLRLNSVSGEQAATGTLADVQAKTVSGTVTLDVTAGCPRIDAQSVSGDLTVRVPAELGLRVSAHTVSGRLVVNGQSHRGTPGTRQIDVTDGDGAASVSAHTVSGDLTVLRAGASS